MPPGRGCLSHLKKQMTPISAGELPLEIMWATRRETVVAWEDEETRSSRG